MTNMVPIFPPFSNLKVKSSKPEGSPSSAKKSKRSISFADAARIRMTIHVNDFTEEEVKATWYNRRDLHDIKIAIKEILRQNNGTGTINVDSTQSCDREQQCSRGLEGYTISGSAQKKKNKLDAARAVFAEQEGQLNYGIIDDEELALIYARYTRHCQAIAHSRALQDELEVQAMNTPPAPLLLSSPLQQFKSASPSIFLVGQQSLRKISSKAAQAA